MVECLNPYLNEWTVQDTRVKHFVNGSYAGTLILKLEYENAFFLICENIETRKVFQYSRNFS
jgi:hypothetical protein